MMRRLLILFYLAIFSFNKGISQHGSLDPTFGNQGNAVHYFGENETIYSLFIDQGVSGRIATSGAESGCVLIYDVGYVKAFLENGDLDSSFGANGQVFVNTELLGPFGDIHVLDDDSVLYSTGQGGILRKLRPDGSIDNSFGDNGVLSMDGQGIGGIGHKLHPDGSIFLTGISLPNHQQIIIKKYNTDGVLDSSFGNQGTTSIAIDSFFQFTLKSLRIKFNSTIFVFYALQPSFNDPFNAYMSKLSPNGTLDTTFGDNGRLTLDIENAEHAKYYLLDGDNLLVSYHYYDSQLMAHVRKIVRLTPNGEVDTSFANNGSLIDNSVEIIEQNQRIITNATFPDIGGELDPHLNRFFPNGDLDNSFNFEYTYSELNSITTTPSTNGGFLLGGADHCNNGPQGNLLIAKYTSTPLGIESEDLERLLIYPNPATDEVFLSGLLEEVDYSLYNVLGLEIKRGEVSPDSAINISGLLSGIYVLKLADGRSGKIVVE